jgi:hypothetical protein
MPAIVTWRDARAILGDDVLGPDEVALAFGLPPGATPPPVPFAADELASAASAGEMLVLRTAEAPAQRPLTILSMVERFPAAFDQKLLRQVGYQLKDEWGITLEPLAATATCQPGWALVRKDVLDESRNRAYDEQEAVLQRYAESGASRTSVTRRRSAVEAVYDTVLYFSAREKRLLAKSWDWCASRTIDGGYLNVGGFAPAGMQILSFSRGIRHGGLGVCPTRQPLG